MADTSPRQVTFHLRRFEPGEDREPHWEDHRIEVTPGMTVLDGLWKVKELSAPSLAWRSSCRMGICGSCGMLINGRPRLACNTQVTELASDVVAVGPLPNFDIIKDLVPDLRPMFETHRELMPYLIRDDTQEQDDPTGEYWQAPHELEQYLQFSYCIKCGCCMAACPPSRQTRTTPDRCPWARPTATTATPATPASGSAARCSRVGAGRGAATSPASARRSAPRAWTRPRRSSS